MYIPCKPYNRILRGTVWPLLQANSAELVWNCPAHSINSLTLLGIFGTPQQIQDLHCTTRSTWPGVRAMSTKPYTHQNINTYSFPNKRNLIWSGVRTRSRKSYPTSNPVILKFPCLTRTSITSMHISTKFNPHLGYSFFHTVTCTNLNL